LLRNPLCKLAVELTFEKLSPKLGGEEAVVGVVFSGVRQDVPRSWIVDKVDAEGSRVAVCCSVRCSACCSVCCTVLHCVAAWCFRVFGKMFVLQCVAACCSVVF